MVLNTLGILLPAISADLDLSPSQQGLLGSASHWGNIALAIPLSWATSRLSPKWLTAATLLVATGCLFLQSWAPVFIVLLAGRLMFGISNIAQMPARALLTRQWFPPREVIYLNGLSNVLFGLVVGGGLVLAPVILDLTNGDWRATLRIFGLYFAGITLLWTLVGRERTNVADQDVVAEKGLDVLKGALGHRDLWIGGLGSEQGSPISIAGEPALDPAGRAVRTIQNADLLRAMAEASQGRYEDITEDEGLDALVDDMRDLSGDSREGPAEPFDTTALFALLAIPLLLWEGVVDARRGVIGDGTNQRPDEPDAVRDHDKKDRAA